MSTCSSESLVQRVIILSASNESDRDMTYVVWPNFATCFVRNEFEIGAAPPKRAEEICITFQPHGNITKTTSRAIPPSNGDAWLLSVRSSLALGGDHC